MAIIQDNLTDLLGTSLKFPLQIDASGKVVLVSGQANIEQAIKDIIMTLRNTRFYLPQYGSNVSTLRGLPPIVSSNLAKLEIKNALASDKRIIVRDINVVIKEQVLEITITYQLRNSTIVNSTVISV